jgi:hypothetical protein
MMVLHELSPSQIFSQRDNSFLSILCLSSCRCNCQQGYIPAYKPDEPAITAAFARLVNARFVLALPYTKKRL